ncbi:hypothetical protein Ahy_B01g053318 [Arachis hypogaea]|uniref:Replication protein A 70 kDa DNA-binding subunit B/D first OB fold domain-containing protein n=1 Tax=Arachis hypogaea TaxID=3818 RepID=A0A445ARH8_ARAHY|nr:hypothetical protein Ahy_B01g053318 [Arachis hypogaea]
MAGIHKIGEINPTIDNLCVRIRVIRLWTLSSYGNSSLPYSIEMVWLDEDMALVSRFVNLVKEGISYQIRYFGVGLNEGNFKTTHNEYVVNLNQRTDVHKLPKSSSIIRYGFNFVSFDTLNTLGYDYTYLRELNAFLGSDNKDGVVVVLQFIRNSMYGTKMFFNLEEANVIQFKNRWFNINYVLSNVVFFSLYLSSFVRFEEPRDNIDAISNEAALLKIYQGKIIEQLKELDTHVRNKAWCHCDSDCACFVVFDKETKQVLEKSCKEDLSDTPILLLNLIDKIFLFIVKVQISDNLHFSPSYKVKKMTDNVDLINKFKKAHPIQIVSTDVDYTSGLLPTLKASSIIEGEKVEGAKLRTMMNLKCWKTLLHQPSDYPQSRKIQRCKEIPQLARRSRLRMKLENLVANILKFLSI